MTPRSFVLGVIGGVVLPSLVLIVLAAMGRLGGYFEQSRGYALLPVFAPLGVLAFFLGWRLFERLQVPRMGASFSLGLLVAGSLVGSLVLWLSSPERPTGNRLVFSVFGGPLVLGFWLWIGGILGYAWRQQRALRTLAPHT